MLSDLTIDAVVSEGRAAEFHNILQTLGEGRRFPPLRERPAETRPSLRIVYLAPRVDVGGGARIIIEHANRLADRGHQVLLQSHFPEPDWTDIRCAYRRVPLGEDLSRTLPACDLVVCGYWDQLAGARSAGVAPVVHFEQGDFHLFEDTTPEWDTIIRSHLSAADMTITVSQRVARILTERYQVADVHVAHNAVDPDVFHPAAEPSGGGYVLCVGWDGNDFKGIADVRTMWASLSRRRPGLRLVWVTPRPPKHGPVGEVVVAPAQKDLAALYRGAAAYICASHYESFPLPPLESMASGTPVVTTSNVGVMEYARDGTNALVVPVKDPVALGAALERLLDDEALSARLRSGGLETAAAFSWQRIVDGLEDRYRSWSRLRISGPAAGPGSWKRQSNVGDPLDSAAEQLLRSVMSGTDARQVWVPVTRPFRTGIQVTSWELAAERTRGGKGSVKVPAPHCADQWRSTSSYAAALNLLRAGRAASALPPLAEQFQAATAKARRGALAKWLGVCLIDLGQADEARGLVDAAAGEFPDNPDFLALACVLHDLGRPLAEPQLLIEAILTLGSAARYDDWFSEPRTVAAGAGLLKAMNTVTPV